MSKLSQKILNAISLLLSIALLGVVVFGIVAAIVYFAHAAWTLVPVLLTTNSDIAKAIVSAGGAILLAVVTHSYGKKLERQMQIEEEHRKHKIEAYEKFFELTFKIIKQQKGQKIDQVELVDGFFKVTELFIIWSSDKVISAWTKFRLTAQKPEFQKNALVILEPMEELMMAIRKDLGHKDRTLRKGEILSTFLNDYDQLAKDKPTQS